MRPGSKLSERQQRTADRHAEILAEALELMAERGYHGASLRALASRLGISQPSLYHYFSSKEELVEQIIEAHSQRMFEGVPQMKPNLDTLPAKLRDFVFALYEDTDHPLFVRFVFAVSRIEPRFGRLNREIFVNRARALFGPVVLTLSEEHGLDAAQLGRVFQTLINAIGFRLMEETVLYDERPIGDDTRAFADEVVATVSSRLQALKAEAKARG